MLPSKVADIVAGIALASLPLVPVVASLQIPLPSRSHSQTYRFDALLHLPGISPYFDAVGSGLEARAPQNCEVTAASYLIRHAAIYANDADYEDYIEPFLTKINTTYISSSGGRRRGWKGPLEFFETWVTPIEDPDKQLEQITPSGIEDSKKVGKHLLSRYPTLVPTMKTIYADTKSRTHDTAVAFIKAFPQTIEIVDIDLHNRSSFHAQDPHKACKAFSKSPGNDELATFISHYTPAVISRLEKYAPVELDGNDIMGMQQLCGYESAIRGEKSSICDAFTDAEWMAYEYAWDLKYSLMVGHGNPLSSYLGFPWLNTTSQLMSKFHAPRHSDSIPEIPDDDGQRFFLAFTHREVPPFIATALGLFNSSNSYAEEFPTDRINWSRSWRMAELIPFLGHVGIEKLTCSGRFGDDVGEKEFIRIIANSAPRPIPKCQDGPGASCSFDRFTDLVRKGMDEYGDFDGICKNKVDVEDSLLKS
ncbi:MAG: hypothetical protein M1818_003356 [Claussenomyces sp. TS43310]|nr:MAG: hypothetical protein M1818_003356 [Claussenomyces sp. TS43310]